MRPLKAKKAKAKKKRLVLTLLAESWSQTKLFKGTDGCLYFEFKLEDDKIFEK